MVASLWRIASGTKVSDRVFDSAQHPGMAVCEPQLATSWLIVLRRNPFRPFLADFIETRVRLRERRHIEVC